MPAPAVVALGETMILFLAQQPGLLREASTFSRHVAGAESNVAVGLCRLGCSAGFISRVGDDEFGRAILFRLRGEGVDVSQVRTDPGAPTGVLFRDRRGPLAVCRWLQSRLDHRRKRRNYASCPSCF
jgi:2-dehydro-3-deoxygluconokinase